MIDGTENEVLEFGKRLLEGLKQTENPEYCETAFRYFLPQTVLVKLVLQRNLHRENWPKLFESFDGQKPLELWIDGVCPGGCLMGLLVWMREESFFDCTILCSGPEGLKSDKIVMAVLQAAQEGGWNLNLVNEAPQEFDLAILSHPKNPTGPFTAKLQISGCLVLVDCAKSQSFDKTRLDQVTPALMELLGSGIEAFDESDRLVVQKLFPSRLPILEQDSYAMVFTRKEVVPVISEDSIQRVSHPSHSSPSPLTKETVKSREIWKGRWINRVQSGACPKELLFSALEVPMASRNATASRAREYYESKRNQGFESRIHMEGMGRPMLWFHYQDT